MQIGTVIFRRMIGHVDTAWTHGCSGDCVRRRQESQAGYVQQSDRHDMEKFGVFGCGKGQVSRGAMNDCPIGMAVRGVIYQMNPERP